MTCTRCKGLMVQDHFLDLLDTDHRTAAWRCVSCGEIIDPVVLANRHRQRSKTEALEMAEALLNSEYQTAKAA